MKKSEQELNEMATKVLNLSNEIGRLMHALTETQEVPLELTHNQFMSAVYLLRLKTATMTEISDASGISASAMTGIIDRLIEKGIAVRERDTDDRRVVKIMLSQKGNDMIGQIAKTIRSKMVALLEKMVPEDRTNLINVFERIIKAIKNNV